MGFGCYAGIVFAVTMYPMRYELSSTEVFDTWLTKLDGSIKRRLANRLLQVENGNFGDYKILSDNFFELRCTFGGGLRIYYTLRNESEIVLLLSGGNKATQNKDIARAKIILSEIKEHP